MVSRCVRCHGFFDIIEKHEIGLPFRLHCAHLVCMSCSRELLNNKTFQGQVSSFFPCLWNDCLSFWVRSCFFHIILLSGIFSHSFVGLRFFCSFVFLLVHPSSLSTVLNSHNLASFFLFLFLLFCRSSSAAWQRGSRDVEATDFCPIVGRGWKERARRCLAFSSRMHECCLSSEEETEPVWISLSLSILSFFTLFLFFFRLHILPCRSLLPWVSARPVPRVFCCDSCFPRSSFIPDHWWQGESHDDAFCLCFYFSTLVFFVTHFHILIFPSCLLLCCQFLFLVVERWHVSAASSWSSSSHH